MSAALINDLAHIGTHEITVTVDPRFPLPVPRAVRAVTLEPGRRSALDSLIASADAVWVIAPESGRCLERLAQRVARSGKTLLGAAPDAIRRAADKATLSRLLDRSRVPHPLTRAPRDVAGVYRAAREIGSPLVVKPRRGAGCEGVHLARHHRDVRKILDAAGRHHRPGQILLQRYVAGTPASVSLLADGHRTVAIAVNRQTVRRGARFSYSGGVTPIDHPLAPRAIDAATRACLAVPGLRGFIGVDLVLSSSEAFVIEVNPRLTTAYLGVRAAVDANVARLVLEACDGHLPQALPMCRRVRFTAAGRTFLTRLPS
jgi:predicted ATP-grasp superfamily ATP-dependent carboligase